MVRRTDALALQATAEGRGRRGLRAGRAPKIFGHGVLVVLGVLAPGHAMWGATTDPVGEAAFLQEGWKLEDTPTPLPRWFEANRVQALLPLSIRRDPGLGTSDFEKPSLGLRILGDRVFTREFKSGCEDPWWPTAVPRDAAGEPLWDGSIRASGEPVTCQGTPTVVDLCDGVPEAQIPEGCRDVAADMIKDAHRRGMHVIAYYWEAADGTVATQHPEWVCRNSDGSIAYHQEEGGRGPHLDLTTPYRKIVLERLLELAERGVDGFNFDFRHMPRPHGCYGTALADDFERVTGIDPTTLRMDEDDPGYRLFLEFQAFKVEETFAYWRAEVKRLFPGVVFVISLDGIPSLGNRRVTTNLIRLADSAKNEYHQALAPRLSAPEEAPRRYVFDEAADPLLAIPPPDVRMAAGWTLLRDSADGRPPRIWGNHQADERHALGFASSILTYGGIAHMFVRPLNLFGDVPSGEVGTPSSALKAAFNLGRRVSPHLVGSRPLRWAAVHFSELIRNRRADLARAWQEHLWPVVGAFGVFVRQGLPVGFVNDRQLEEGALDGYRLLFLPNPEELTSVQKQAVESFQQRGGALLVNEPDWTWSDPGSHDQAEKAFRESLRVFRENHAPAPVQVLRASRDENEPTCRTEDPMPVNSPPRPCIHGVAFENSKRKTLVVAITNDFTWVQRQSVSTGAKLGEHFHWGDRAPRIDELHSPPPPVRDAYVLVSGRPAPKRVFEAVSDQVLEPEPTPAGYRILVPEFQFMALVAIEEVEVEQPSGSKSN